MVRFLTLCVCLLQVLTAPASIAPEIWKNYTSIPSSNTQLAHFDTLIVLGTPTNPDGTPSPELRERVLEAVREYQAGMATHVIMTGAAAHNAFTEAHAMRELAVAKGIPADSIVEEPQALDTIQNLYYSHEIMETRGWKSAEVISSPHHLSRTSLILSHYAFAWRTHAANWPQEYTQAQIDKKLAGEATYCWTLMHAGFPHNRLLPGS